MPGQVERLTERERECLRLVHAHLNSKQIARKLGIKPSTVDRHCENAARKLKAAGRIDAALLLAAGDSLPNDSVSGSFPIAPERPIEPSGDAKGASYDRDRRPIARVELGAAPDSAFGAGRYADETDDGPSSGGGNPQTGAVPDARGDLQGDSLHRRSAARYRLPAFGIGSEHLGRVLLIFAIAAIAALVLTSVIGAERFAFALQGIRYGG